MKSFKIMLTVSLLAAGAMCANAREIKKQQVNSKMKTMTLREQIAQLFVIACHPRQGEQHVKEVLKTLHEEQIGGIIWGECSPEKYINLLNEMQSQVKIPLLVTIDAEWGVAMRLDSVVRFPQQLTLGAIQNNDLIYDFGAEVARQCNEIGVHINFAPVVDVNNNPNNPVINMRSFGENKYKVTEKAYACMKGMQDGGILTCLKHFPGHGDTDKDSHKELPVILHDRPRINDIELYPFRELIKRGATGVMTAHLLIPALSSENVPASQSKKICMYLLQHELKFRGLVITDGLEMQGAIYNRDTSKVAMYALMAGNDILEIPIDVRKSIDEIENAVLGKQISKKLIQKKCKKILEAKYDLGLFEGFKPLNPTGILERLNTEHAKSLRMKLAEASLTLLSNENVLPLSSEKIKYVEIGQGVAFKKQLTEYRAVDTFTIDADYSTESLDSLAANFRNDETIIVCYHNSPRKRSYTNFNIEPSIIDFVDNLAKNNKVILVFFGNPYSIANFKNPERFAALIAAYDNSHEAQISSAKAIFGKLNFSGKLPVTINEYYKEDFGIVGAVLKVI